MPLQLQQCRISPRVYEDSLFLTSSPALVICYILMIIVLTRVRGYHIVVLMCILPMISDVDHLSVCLNHLYIFGTASVQVLCPFYKSGCLFLMQNCMSSLYILAINLLFDISFANIISHRWSFPFLCKGFLFDLSPFVNFASAFLAWRDIPEIHC